MGERSRGKSNFEFRILSFELVRAKSRHGRLVHKENQPRIDTDKHQIKTNRGRCGKYVYKFTRVQFAESPSPTFVGSESFASCPGVPSSPLAKFLRPILG